MKLSQLEYFAAICGNSFNISRAADILHVSQPCISNAIKELESEFGVKLFSRNNKRLELTKEGEICLASVQTILNNTSQLANQMYNIINQKSIIHIGVSSMVSMARISKIITSFKQSNPKIDFDIDIGDSIGFIDSMVNGTQLMDLAIINIHKHIDYNAKNLTVIPIYQTELMLATSTSNKLAKKSFVNYFDLENEPLILNKNNGKKDSIILKRFLNMGISPNIVLYLDSVEGSFYDFHIER
mgnify:FL=1